MVVGALFATVIIGAVGAEKAVNPGGFKSSFGLNDKKERRIKSKKKTNQNLYTIIYYP
ncbi:hypothetical protein [Prochlorococcus marinus]|uniref:hypothetical protein n=1 Tax=Prochlorococcus marinus TaxID=1219 RepID=UPI0022B35EAC|nr:hypothetical protein [Prochlorococcus marinus]